jgi:hypothetical protein
VIRQVFIGGSYLYVFPGKSVAGVLATIGGIVAGIQVLIVAVAGRLSYHRSAQIRPKKYKAARKRQPEHLGSPSGYWPAKTQV